jgi:hypothetical protein
MPISSEHKKRIEDLEFQMESVMEQFAKTDKLLTQIHGGITALKWLAAVLGALLAIWEII